MSQPSMDGNHEQRIRVLESHVEPDVIKQALKDGLREWLDDKFAVFGKWSLMGLAAAGLAALVYFILKANGWQAPQ